MILLTYDMILNPLYSNYFKSWIILGLFCRLYHKIIVTWCVVIWSILQLFCKKITEKILRWLILSKMKLFFIRSQIADRYEYIFVEICFVILSNSVWNIRGLSCTALCKVYCFSTSKFTTCKIIKKNLSTFIYESKEILWIKLVVIVIDELYSWISCLTSLYIIWIFRRTIYIIKGIRIASIIQLHAMRILWK